MPAALEVILLAIGLLAFFALSGWGLLRLLAPELTSEVTAALAPVVGVAAFSVVAAFVTLRVPVAIALPLAAGLPLLVSAIAVGRRRPGRSCGERLRTWLALAMVALVAIVAASVPSLLHGGGMPATWGNADPYLLVSQAKSILDGPPPAPATRYPDRWAYEDLVEGGSAPGYPALTAMTAAVAREDPVEVFGAVVAFVYALTPLVTFVLARCALAWSRRLSVAAAAVVALSPYRLFCSYYGWDQQIAGVACLLAAVFFFRLRLAGGSRRLTVLAAVMVAGVLGVYRLGFLPYLLFATVVVVAGYALTRRRPGVARAVALESGLFAGAAGVLGAPSVLAFLGHGWEFWRDGNDRLAWTSYARGLPSDALGLLPRTPNLAHQPPFAFTLVAMAVSLVVLAGGVRALRRRTAGHPDLVLALCVGSVGALLVAQLPFVTPYFSLKLNGYGAAPMILTALAPLNGRRLPPRRLVVGGLLCLFSLVVVAFGSRATLSAAVVRPLTARAEKLPSSAAVTIPYRSAWGQMWAVYFTRDHPASIVHPSDYAPENIEGRP